MTEYDDDLAKEEIEEYKTQIRNYSQAMQDIEGEKARRAQANSWNRIVEAAREQSGMTEQEMIEVMQEDPQFVEQSVLDHMTSHLNRLKKRARDSKGRYVKSPPAQQPQQPQYKVTKDAPMDLSRIEQARRDGMGSDDALEATIKAILPSDDPLWRP